MNSLVRDTQRLLELLGHDETPFGVHYSDQKPGGGFGPKPGEIFSREREAAGQIDYQKAFAQFSCIVGNIWLARKKAKAAWISHEECGCMGGGFYAGVYRPHVELIVNYVTTGIPGTPMEGERYLPTHDSMRAFLKETAPPPPTGKYCVFKPLDQFADGEEPLVVTFFARPEVVSGLYSLTCYAAGDHHAVATPFSAGCGSIVAWPLVFQQRGEERAVLGGFDLSARKYLKNDELIFSIPTPLYAKMLAVLEDSALTRHTWQGVRKKVLRSRKAWGEPAGQEPGGP